MTELEAARFVRAALNLVHGALPDGDDMRRVVSEWAGELDSLTEAMDAPPWEPEPAPSVELTWSQVIPGDSVLAPNGTWYPVDSVARMDMERMAILLIGPTGQKIRSVPSAQDKVTVRRGPTGLAVDVFRAGGLELEVIGS